MATPKKKSEKQPLRRPATRRRSVRRSAESETLIRLTRSETERFDAALLGADRWEPNETLLEAVKAHNKAVAEGRIKAR